MGINTELVGILNVTPNSFSDGGLYYEPEDALQHARDLFADGAAIVDIGGESTRPGATPITADEEWVRIEPVIEAVVSEYSHDAISLDTYHPENVRRAAEIGKIIVNDVTTFSNPRMRETAAELGLRCIMSHMPISLGQDIQKAHEKKLINSVQQVLDELFANVELLTSDGVERHNIILDPGIGFSKTNKLNRQLLEFARHVPGYEVMIGYSRKRFLGQARGDIEPNLQAGIKAAKSGAKFLRVHDVAAHHSMLATL